MMAPHIVSSVKQSRLHIDIPSAVHEQVRRAAAQCAMSSRAYILHALAERLRQDRGGMTQAIPALTAEKALVLAAFRGKAQHAAYDRVEGGRSSRSGVHMVAWAVGTSNTEQIYGRTSSIWGSNGS